MSINTNTKGAVYIDRTPNGTQLSSEDPLKAKLRKIADSRVQVPPPDLIIKKIKDKLESS